MQSSGGGRFSRTAIHTASSRRCIPKVYLLRSLGGEPRPAMTSAATVAQACEPHTRPCSCIITSTQYHSPPRGLIERGRPALFLILARLSFPPPLFPSSFAWLSVLPYLLDSSSLPGLVLYCRLPPKLRMSLIVGNPLSRLSHCRVSHHAPRWRGRGSFLLVPSSFLVPMRAFALYCMVT